MNRLTEEELAKLRTFIEAQPRTQTGGLLLYPGDANEFDRWMRIVLPKLLDAITERDMIIHDLQLDSEAYRRGTIDATTVLVEAAKKGVELSKDHPNKKAWNTEEARNSAETVLGLVLAVSQRGYWDEQQLLPPHQARMRADHYQKALEKIRDIGYSPGVGVLETLYGSVRHLADIAQKALEVDS